MKGRAEWSAALAVAAAIVGAGFASGREIVTFFSWLGAASWLGILAACAGIGYLTYVIMRLAVHTGAHSFPQLYGVLMGAPSEHAMHGLYGLLMLLTGAAMLAAGGELGALALPMHSSRAIGAILTLAVAGFAARSGIGRLAALGFILAPAVVAYYALMALDGQRHPVTFEAEGFLLTVPLGLIYAALNVAIAGGAACLAARTDASPVRTGLYTGLLLAIMLVPANAAFLTAGEHVRSMAMPSVVLAARWGVGGYYASIAVMWLAVTTTLCAVMCALMAQLAAVPSLNSSIALLITSAAMALFSIYGFESLINVGYPLMGWLCAIALVALPIFLPKSAPR